MNLTELLTLFQAYGGLLFAICSVPIGYLLIRSGFSKQLDVIQRRVIAAQEVERQALQKEIDDLKSDLARQKRIMHTVQIALKRRGLVITVDGDDFISLFDMGKQQTMTIPVQNSKEE